jgi:sugar diacid utilization regulator
VDDLQRIAEALADRLQRAVAIDDPQLHLLAHTSHHEEIDELRVESIMRLQVPQDVVDHVLGFGIAQATAPVRIPATPQIGLLPRVCVPVRCQGLLLGYLWLIDQQGTLTDDDIAAAQEAADAAGQLLLRQQLLGDLRDSRERELLRDLLADDESLHQTAADALVDEDLVPRPGAVTALAVTVDEDLDAASRAAMDAALRRVARRTSPSTGLALTRGNGRGLLVLCSRRPSTSGQLAAAAEVLRDSLLAVLGPTAGVRVGIGPTVSSLTDAGLSARRAWEAVAVTGAIPALGDVAVWDELGVYKLLARLPQHDVADTLPDGLVRLIETDQGGPLVETLETWLDEGGDPRASIARLSIHRTSLYYRIGRIEEITGMRLGNGHDRLALHLGLKVARLLGRLPPQG